MFRISLSIFSLLFSTVILLLGISLQSRLQSLRAELALLNSIISIESALQFYTAPFLFGEFVFIFYGLCAAHVDDQIDAGHSLEAAQDEDAAEQK